MITTVSLIVFMFDCVYEYMEKENEIPGVFQVILRVPHENY